MVKDDNKREKKSRMNNQQHNFQSCSCLKANLKYLLIYIILNLLEREFLFKSHFVAVVFFRILSVENVILRFLKSFHEFLF